MTSAARTIASPRQALASAVLALGGCVEAPLSALSPAGPGAAPIATVWWVMAWGSLAILAGVVALGLFAAMRRRPPTGPGTSRLLIVGGGLVLPLVAILGLLAFGVRSGHSLLPLGADGYRVDVVAHQWWWEVRYPGSEAGALVSANEIHIPAGRPVDLHVTANDVVHGFWVPRLGGKIDALPGRINVVRLEADRPGVYRGQCAEFCGAQHARMGFYVIAHEEAALAERLERLAASSREPDQTPASFRAECASCHSVDAQEEAPRAGPNLADLAHRRTLGAGWLANEPALLRRWLRRHQSIKPGNRMPDHADMDEATLEEIAHFLEDGE